MEELETLESTECPECPGPPPEFRLPPPPRPPFLTEGTFCSEAPLAELEDCVAIPNVNKETFPRSVGLNRERNGKRNERRDGGVATVVVVVVVGSSSSSSSSSKILMYRVFGAGVMWRC
uniref:Uncharacterized protein n=1 Tax=Vespula pensylvanica TaxID=30213 RepID=A0A834PBZ7_VESPE|nr:hypothetical protein H0235_003458 [Vespula pensylvanica]